eukprot:TRINITY_DN9630_c0_g5_i1.p1 TRINITY_DN9630_c0_g5~~TRINITY_DN9630_c0_g5_i1.p1  ORF type:complete len:216 (+),score=30.76 TRINITY_DN9630_c0_g5_i1:156-803(+)
MRKDNRKVCRFFSQPGGCRKGDMCEFEHVGGGGGFGGGNTSKPTRPRFEDSRHAAPYSHRPRHPYEPRHGRGPPFRPHEEQKYCRAFQRGDCTNLQHTNHVLPSGIERKTVLELDHGQGAEHREVIGMFVVNASQFGACTDFGTLNIWNNSFAAVDKRSLGIPCTAVAYFSTSSGMFLVFGSQFQAGQTPSQYGICATDGTTGVTFPVVFHSSLP